MSAHRILIAGSGGIGRAVGLLLRELGDLDVDLVFGDLSERQARSAATFVSTGSSVSGNVETLVMPRQGTTGELDRVLADADLILDCLPGSQAPRVAGWALQHAAHYANLTEYVAETERILTMAEGASTGFALQCGLAPGFVNVVGNLLYKRFQARHGSDLIDTMKMRVGALTRNAEAPHYYGFTWSPIGVATEYVKDAIVVRDGQSRQVPSLGEIETLLIDGVAYEEATTSGGAADMPEALAGRATSLDYKTLRYPGHWAWVKRQLAEIGDVPDRIRLLEERMMAQVPLVEDDVVVIYAGVDGRDSRGMLRRSDRAYKVYPTVFGGQRLRAIQSTTAAGLAECARVLLGGGVRGPLLQSHIDAEDYMAGPYVSAVYGDHLAVASGS